MSLASKYSLLFFEALSPKEKLQNANKIKTWFFVGQL